MKLEEIKKLNIYEKMSLITDEIGVIEKNLNVQVNKNASYKAVSERDVLDAVKPTESKYIVYSYPTKRTILESEVLVKETEYNGTTTKNNTLFLRVETTYRFVNLDNTEEYIETTVYGDGLDTGDKAPGKAMTYADKYALMKAYKLSTGDDPDKEPSPAKTNVKTSKKTTKTETAQEYKISPKQIEILEKFYTGDNLTKLLESNGISKLQDMSMLKADEIIKRIKEMQTKGNEK